MFSTVLALGDTDISLAHGIATNAAGAGMGADADSPARAIIVFADLRDLSRHDIKERLRSFSALALAETRRRPRIRHVVFAVMLPLRRASIFDRVASALGTRLHADLERERGRDVEVTFLDVSHCNDAPLLTERLLARSSDPTGRNGVVVLDWDDIRDHTIAHAARIEYL